MEWILSACVGVGLAACCGFRIFVPMLVAAAATHFGLIGTMPGFEWLGSWTAIIGLSIATSVELVAYYIPWVDNALDAIAMPVSVVAGTLLSTSFLRIDDSMVRWCMGLMLGGGSAGIIQAGTSLLRLGSTATTGGLANPVVATSENAASLGLSVLMVFVPLAAFVAVLCLVLFFAFRLLGRRRLSFTKADVPLTPPAPLAPPPPSLPEDEM
ncbi:DUF4126 domain-containing protein [Fibrella aquatilis]|uniref:DUF4126 domain-containing protein n=1 Tax=Fibrella aquatilis TaxID=2817059 RepID=A0A939G686_9BACT|nr:DUF4126 domain-containing protein [Fibrella aquatilis]MBO0932641.1 DUF4126 domain-containing protein [Fibrella aquatilis]